jgi:hypothetical protein
MPLVLIMFFLPQFDLALFEVTILDFLFLYLLAIFILYPHPKLWLNSLLDGS